MQSIDAAIPTAAFFLLSRSNVSHLCEATVSLFFPFPLFPSSPERAALCPILALYSGSWGLILRHLLSEEASCCNVRLDFVIGPHDLTMQLLRQRLGSTMAHSNLGTISRTRTQGALVHDLHVAQQFADPKFKGQIHARGMISARARTLACLTWRYGGTSPMLSAKTSISRPS